MKQVSLISVIGGGLMGHGIALTLAQAGHQVRVMDLSLIHISEPTRRRGISYSGVWV